MPPQHNARAADSDGARQYRVYVQAESAAEAPDGLMESACALFISTGTAIIKQRANGRKPLLSAHHHTSAHH